MKLVEHADILNAAEAIADVATHTPLIPAAWAGSLWLKPEMLQPIGSFKLRGASAAVAALPDDTRGVVTHSSGNHGRAIAHAAMQRGFACTVVVPDTAPAIKMRAIRDTGARLEVVPPTQRASRAERIRDTEGYALIPFDRHDVIAGQGTVALEILDDMPDTDTIVVPVGGGGLAAGAAVAAKAIAPHARVIGVQPELAADAVDSLRAGQLVEWSTEDRYRTIADGVRVGLAELTCAHILRYLDEVVTVSEDEILDAITDIASHAHLVCEPSGALSLAGYQRHGAGWGRTVAVLSGGNIDPQLLSRLLASSTDG